jgi:hypothetical protein
MITKQDITRTIFTLCKEFIAPEKHQVDLKNSIAFVTGAWISFDEKTFTLHDPCCKSTIIIAYLNIDRVLVEAGKYGVVTIIFGCEMVDTNCIFEQQYGLTIYDC